MYNLNDLKIFFELNYSKLFSEQQIIYDTIMSAIENQSGGLYFLDAPGGCGKTFLISLILAKIRIMILFWLLHLLALRQLCQVGEEQHIPH